MLLALLACVPRADVRPPSPETPPTLPSPRADVYARAPGAPKDPAVALAVAGMPWDEALSGAAASIGLDVVAREGVDPWRVRWKAIIAGYPYPAEGPWVERVEHGAIPKDLVTQARARVAVAPAWTDVGLVRVRSHDDDVWVLLFGARRGEVGAPIPRELALGESVDLGPLTWTASDPLGDVLRVEGSFSPDQAGEWLLRGQADGVTVASLPVYVDQETPASPRISGKVQGDSADAQVRWVLQDVRRRYEIALLAPDTALDSVARARLAALLDGRELPDAERQLRAAGFTEGPVASAECRASSVPACLDQAWWTPEGRDVFVTDARNVGVATALVGGRVVAVMVAAG